MNSFAKIFPFIDKIVLILLFSLGACKTETNDVNLLAYDENLKIEIEHVGCLGGNSFRQLEITLTDSGNNYYLRYIGKNCYTWEYLDSLGVNASL